MRISHGATQNPTACSLAVIVFGTEGKCHVLASGLYSLANSPHASNFSTVYAAYAVSSLPLLVPFISATKPFIQGMTSGALKA